MSMEIDNPPKTLPGRYYTDRKIFRDELERFFCRMWICPGREEQVANAGDFLVREIADESIIVTHNESRSVNAFFNVCRHRGTRICADLEGKFAGRIQCPYHGWTYALDGKLIGAPHMNHGFRRGEDPLHPLLCEGGGGHVIINLHPPAPPPRAQLDTPPTKIAQRAIHG